MITDGVDVPMKKWLFGALILAIALGGGYFAFVSGADTTAQQAVPTASLPAVQAPDAIIAEAKVVPVRNAALSLPNGGVIAEVLAAEGEHVRAGQTLARLTNTQQAARVMQAEADVARAQAAYDKLHAGASPQQIAVAEAELQQAQAQLRQTDGSVTAADLRAAEAQLQQARAELEQLTAGPQKPDLQDADARLQQARAQLSSARDQLSATKAEARSKLEQAANALRDRQAEYDRIYWENRRQEEQLANIGQELPRELKDQEAVALRAVRNAEESLKQAQLAYEQAQQAETSGVAAAEAQVRSAQALYDKQHAGAEPDKIAAARANLADAQAQLERLRGDQRHGQLSAAEAAVARAQAQLDMLRAGASSNDLAVAQAELQSANAALATAKAILAETELRAPFDGVIAALDLRTGEYVAPGVPVIRLADVSAWQIETDDLTELNIVNVREGAAATIAFDAIPTVTLPGKVTRIKSFGENKQGDITYTVIIAPAQHDERLRWNMTASVTIEASGRPLSRLFP